MGNLAFLILIFLFVAGRSIYRAYDSVTNGDKTAPISILLAIAVVILGLGRFFFGFGNTDVYIGLIICIIASQLVYRSGRKARS